MASAAISLGDVTLAQGQPIHGTIAITDASGSAVTVRAQVTVDLGVPVVVSVIPPFTAAASTTTYRPFTIVPMRTAKSGTFVATARVVANLSDGNNVTADATSKIIVRPTDAVANQSVMFNETFNSAQVAAIG